MSSGYSPLLKIISDTFVFDHNKFLLQNIPVLKSIIRILVKVGAEKNSVFHDEEEMEKLKNNPHHSYKNKCLEGYNMLHFMAHSSKLGCLKFDQINGVVEFLIKEIGVEYNHQNIDGFSPLFLATSTKLASIETIKLLLECGADPNLIANEGSSAIFKTVTHSRLDITTLMVAQKANLNVCNQEGLSPLILAIKKKDVVLVEDVLKLGADPNFKDNYGRNSLHWAINYSDAGANASFELETVLIEHGAEINTTDMFGRTPLHYPFIKTNDFTINTNIDPIEAVNSLLGKKDLLIDQEDLFGNTPLMYAAQRGSLVSTLYLLDKGADIHKKNIEGNNPLSISMINENFNLAVLLLNNGAEWNTFIFKYSPKIREEFYKYACDHIKNSDLNTELKKILAN